MHGDEAVSRSKEFWLKAFEYGATLPADWHLGSSVHGSGIPKDKWFNFRWAADRAVGQDRSLLYYDGTVFGSGKKGILVTDEKMYVYCHDDGKIWNIALSQARVHVDVKDSTIRMNDKKSLLSLGSDKFGHILQLYFVHLQQPNSVVLDRELLKILNPASLSPLLAKLKKIGVEDPILAALADNIADEDKVVASAAGVIITDQWVLGLNQGPFQRDEIVSLLIKKESPAHSDDDALKHAGQHIARHPSTNSVVMAGVGLVMHVVTNSMEEPKFSVYVARKGSDGLNWIAGGFRAPAIEEVKKACANAGVHLSVITT